MTKAAPLRNAGAVLATTARSSVASTPAATVAQQRVLSEQELDTATKTPIVDKRDKASSLANRMQTVAASLGFTGDIVAFGSLANGFGMTGSDCDLTYIAKVTDSAETPVKILQKFALELPKRGFKHVVSIFQATVPLVKAVDPDGVEVDFCVGNRLGVQNSRLMSAYCAVDQRVSEIVMFVKLWVKARDLVGSIDGHLSSYAYTLLVVFYLMQTSPPVLPNLQDLARAEDSFLIPDSKWGKEVSWECKFWSDVHLILKSSNAENVHSLLRGFFRFYTTQFDWSKFAVSIRLALTPHSPISKFGLHTAGMDEQWFVEDPFDLCHNLASRCTNEGRQRILHYMREAIRFLETPRGTIIPGITGGNCQPLPMRYFLKCRIHVGKVTAAALVNALRAARVVKRFLLYFPTQREGSHVRIVFFEFLSDNDKRSFHQLNETYIDEWQLRLLPCGAWLLQDLSQTSRFSVIPVESFGDCGLNGTKDSSEEVRKALRATQDKEEVSVLIQRAEALDLQSEVNMGREKLMHLEAAGMPTRSRSSTETTLVDEISLLRAPIQAQVQFQ